MAKFPHSTILTKKGLYGIYDYGKRRKVPKNTPILCMLRLRFEVEENITVGDFLRFIKSHDELYKFSMEYSWCTEHHFLDLENAPDDICDDIDHIQLSYSMSVMKGTFQDDGDPNECDISDGSDCSGIATKERQKKEGHGEFYSMSATPIRNWQHLPLKLKKECRIDYSNINEKAPKRWHRTLAKGDRSFTLLEAIDALLWDMSFYGIPGPPKYKEEKDAS